MSAEAPRPTAANLKKIVRQATVPAAELLAETHSALLLVDVTNRFIVGSNLESPASTIRVLQPISALLEAARTKNIARFFVTAGHYDGASDTGPSLRRLADMGSDVRSRLDKAPHSTWGSDIPAVIAPQRDEVHLTKLRTSAFYGTGLELLLRGAGIETVVLAGVASYGCIIATYLDAGARGFFPLVCAQAIDGARAARHDAAMEVMGSHSQISVDDVVRIWANCNSRTTGACGA
jgi:nicotinamidase-related amidase